jgi:hypothetical protein
MERVRLHGDLMMLARLSLAATRARNAPGGVEEPAYTSSVMDWDWFVRFTVKAALVGVVLTALCWFVVPLATLYVWYPTLCLIAAALIELVLVGVGRTARYFANPS